MLGATSRRLARRVAAWRTKHAARGVSDGADAAKGASGSSASGKSDAREDAAAQQRAWARRATAMMFPWERAALDGDASKPYTTWQKFYFVAGAVALSALVWERMGSAPWRKEVDAKTAEQEARRIELARKAARGSLTSEEEAEAFDGMSPDAIDALVARVAEEDRQAWEGDADTRRRAAALGIAPPKEGDDPFEGMAPEDIDKFVQSVREDEERRVTGAPANQRPSEPLVFRIKR